jgi:DNA-binding PadR family transcriptional regulator
MNERNEGGRHGRGPHRRRRGDIRTAILAVLSADGPGHGYEIIQALEGRSGGRWRPSPGSIYPTLQQLEDEGLVTGAEVDGRRIFTVTDAGRAEAKARLERAGRSPWEGEGPDLRGHIKSLALAYRQVVDAGSPEMVERANQVLTDARKQLYRLLAED